MKWVCSVCGYVYEGSEAPEFCPQCKAPRAKFVKAEGEKVWAAEHVVGVASDVPEEIKQGLRLTLGLRCTSSRCVCFFACRASFCRAFSARRAARRSLAVTVHSGAEASGLASSAGEFACAGSSAGSAESS